MTVQRQTSLAVVFFVMLAVLTACVWSGYTNGFDVQFHGWVLGVLPSGNEIFWECITFFGSGLAISTLTVLAVVILSLRRKWEDLKYLIFVMVAAAVTEVTMKWLIHRPRPIEVFTNTLPNSFSFPSGHTIYGTAFYFAMAVIVIPNIKGSSRVLVWFAAAVISFLIGVSRIFLGVHYLTDVMGGFLVAGFWLTQPWSFSKNQFIDSLGRS